MGSPDPDTNGIPVLQMDLPTYLSGVRKAFAWGHVQVPLSVSLQFCKVEMPISTDQQSSVKTTVTESKDEPI